MELKSIHSIFTDRIYRIPAYQRGYSWANNKPLDRSAKNPFKDVYGQLKDIWEDISNINGDNWHYTGLLTLVEMKSDYDWLPTYKQYAIVDGQQRITTCLILLAVLIKEAEALKIELGMRSGDARFKYICVESTARAFLFGYDTDNPSDNFFKKKVLEVDVIVDNSKESSYTENLTNAKSFFEDAVYIFLSNQEKHGISRVDALRILFKCITTQLRFNEYVLPLELNEYVVFETMNNRGKPLSELERLKNRLMYLSSKLPIADNDQIDEEQKKRLITAQQAEMEKSINSAWITIYESLGANKQRPLDDEEFVYNHWIIFFDEYNRSVADAYSTFLFDEYFTLPNLYSGALTKDSIIEYILSLQQSAIIWNKICNPSFFTSEEAPFKDHILRLYRVGFKPSFKPITLAALRRKDKKDYLQVLSLLEDFSFKLFAVADRQSNTGDSKLYRLAYQVYQEGISADNCYNDINGFVNHYYKFELFQGQVTELFETRQGYYNWSGLKYFLFEYDLHLRKSNSNTDRSIEINWDDFKAKNSIEHIYPQSASLSYEAYSNDRGDSESTQASYHRLMQDWSLFQHLNSDQRFSVCNSLGNLLALTVSINSSISNDPFIYKVDQGLKGEQYKNKGFKYDSMSARLVANSPVWSPESIKLRGLDMLDFLWNKLHPGLTNTLTEQQKLSLLGLDFMYEPISLEANPSNT